ALHPEGPIRVGASPSRVIDVRAARVEDGALHGLVALDGVAREGETAAELQIEPRLARARLDDDLSACLLARRGDGRGHVPGPREDPRQLVGALAVGGGGRVVPA